MNHQNENPQRVSLIHAHICPDCGRAARRDEPDGTPDAAGVFHRSQCGHEGPLNEAVIEETDERRDSQSYSATAARDHGDLVVQSKHFLFFLVLQLIKDGG